MQSKLRVINKIFLLLTLNILIIGAFLPAFSSEKINSIKGFEKGLSYCPVIPIKKTTFVKFDEDSLVDDYAYLAAIPTTVFKSNGNIFSYPLLFYQDKLDIDDDKDLSLDAWTGIKYFMEDWIDYCYELDQMVLINVDEKNVNQWKSKNYTKIDGNNPIEIANIIALMDWSYSNNAVIAIINQSNETFDYIDPVIEKGTLKGGKDIIEHTFFSENINAIAPRSHIFTIPNGYKYIKSRTWWSSFWAGTQETSAFPLHINITIPAADPDSQLYCQYEDKWMEVAVSSGWNIGGMDKERIESYIYKSGQWRLSITDVPTKKIIGKNGRIFDILINMLKGVTYQTDINIYPGEELKTSKPITPPLGCSDITFKLSWDNLNFNLGFTIIGPEGEEILTCYEEKADGILEMHLDQLGECIDGESYKISVFSFDKLYSDVDYKIEYTWKQNISEKEADSLLSASNGAVIASTLNAPLLYSNPSLISDTTMNVLYKLGVENVYLINIGNHATNSNIEKIKEVTNIEKNIIEPIELYKEIINLTNQNDIIFTTINPWTKWYVSEMVPAEETNAALFIGPASYIAAHHGSPVLIVDSHPELSSAVVYHTEFWKRNGNGYEHPTVAQMYLTGKSVYDFIGKIGLDKEGEETMITVADQYDIGASWDRVFVGKATPGRFFGSPVDTSYWISHNIFYPALIFNNPALDSTGVNLLQGSKSIRRNIFPWGNFGLKITKQSKIENFKYPVLQTYICFEHKTNERFETYYGFKYKSADNIVPGVTDSNNPIDEGLNPGVVGAIWPDMTPTEIIPAYLEKGGYNSVFSTSFDAITDNLNEGVILWFSTTHGNSANSGQLLTWDPKVSAYGSILNGKLLGYQKENNPWRGYEWYLGSTDNPDTMTMEVHGLIPALLGNPNLQGLFPTGEDFWPSERPILHGIFGFLNKLPIIKWIIPEWLASDDYYKDGLVIAHTITTLATSTTSLNGYTIDEKLENLRSLGWINTACLPAYKYLHLTMVRHGSAFQVIDPWSTSWYSALWFQSIPRDIILGDTIGEAYRKGISHVGILYVDGAPEGGPQWWWDDAENVIYFGDPDLRVYVPNSDYNDANTWDKPKTLTYEEELNINGHSPYGTNTYPNEKTQKTLIDKYLWLFVILGLIAILLIVVVLFGRKRIN